MIWFRISMLLFLTTGLFGCHLHHDEACHHETGVFIHLSHGADQPHRALMGLQMAVLMAEAGQPVLVYCDIKAVMLCLKEAEDVSFSHFQSSQAQIKKLLEMGVKVTVCPGCLKSQDKTPEDVMEGIEIASKEAFFGFTKGRILTLDY